MTSVYIALFWSFLLVVVPRIASAVGGGDARVNRVFSGSCAPLALLLLFFMPRRDVSPCVALVATFVFSGLIAVLYLALAPSVRQEWRGLLVVLGVIDAAAVLAIYLCVGWLGVGPLGFAVLVVVMTGGMGVLAIWAVRRLGWVRKGA